MESNEQPGQAKRWMLKRARGLIWSGVIVAYGVLAFGWLWKAGGAGMSDAAAQAAFAALIVQTFAFHGGLVLLVVLASALMLRMRLAALVLVPALAWTLGPAVWSWVRPLPAQPPAGTPVLVVFSANVLYSNTHAEDLMSQVDRVDADVVLLQEFDAGPHAELERRIREKYPHARTWPQSDSFGQAVFSRIPFESEPTLWWGGDYIRVPQLEFEVTFEGTRVAVWNIHPLPPAGNQYIIEQRGMIVSLGERVDATMSADDAPDAIILAGDFNAPWGTGHLRELSATGLRDAHRAAGLGRGGTWPRNGVLRFAPSIALDHALYSGDLRCVHAAVGEDFGSDHRPIVAQFTVDRGK